MFFFFKQKTAYEMLRSLVGSEMCIRDRPRVPLITGVMKAMKAQINIIDPATLKDLSKGMIDESASKISVLTYETPSARPTVKIIDGETPEQKVKALIDILKDEAKAL